MTNARVPSICRKSSAEYPRGVHSSGTRASRLLVLPAVPALLSQSAPAGALDPVSKPAHRSTRKARRVFQRLGKPSLSISKWVGPWCVFSSGQRPSGLAPVGDERDRIGDPVVRPRARPPEVVEGTEHVVVPPWREREHRESRVHGRPVDRRRNRRRSSRYSSPRRRAVVTLLDDPPACSHSRRPSRTDSVEWNDDTVAPYGAQQFQPPSGELVGEQSRHDPIDVLAEVGADRQCDAVDARLFLALEVESAVRLPSDVLAHE